MRGNEEMKHIAKCLESKGFTVKRSGKNRAKAVSPKGEMFIFSLMTRDKHAAANTRAMLRRKGYNI